MTLKVGKQQCREYVHEMIIVVAQVDAGGPRTVNNSLVVNYI